MKVSPVRDRRTANPVALAQLSTRQYFLAPDLLACVARLREGIGTQLGLIEVRQAAAEAATLAAGRIARAGGMATVSTPSSAKYSAYSRDSCSRSSSSFAIVFEFMISIRRFRLRRFWQRSRRTVTLPLHQEFDARFRAWTSMVIRWVAERRE